METARRATRTGRSVVGDLVNGAVLKERQIYTVRTPIVREGKVKYVIAAAIDPEPMRRLLERQNFPQDWIASIVDRNYRFVARTHAAPGGAEQITPAMRESLATKTEGWQGGPTLEGGDAFRAYARSTYSGWSVVMAMPSQAYFRSGWQAALLIGAGALLAMGAGVGLALLLARRITQPIASLAAAAPMLGRGETPPPSSGERVVDEVRDLTAALHDAGRSIRERETALRAADRAKDEFLAMLGHELRNPLATLSTAADLLKLGRDRPGVLDTAQALIGRQSAHMAHLVDDLLEVGRVTGGKIRLEKEPLDLARVVATVIETWRNGDRLLHHTVESDLHEVWVHADRTRIEQVVANLLDNALKYTPANGRVDVSVRAEAGAAIVEVRDTGEGMPPELIGRVFDLFVQGERSLARERGGLGIGLTLARRLVEMNDGTIRATSAGRGQGATFTVSLPAIERPAAADGSAATSVPSADAGRPRPRILIVEDNADARASLAMLLRLERHEVQTAENGEQGLALARAGTADIVLLDIGLPDVDGYEIARRLKADPATRHLWLLAVTGYGTQDDRRRALAAGFDEHLAKPVEPDELEAFLQRAAGRAGETARPNSFG
jgi:signal transduction histidine kinase/ActR/RegA family two-component response regulator